MATAPTLRILLCQDLWQPDIVEALTQQGHEVSMLQAPHDVVIGYTAWRVPAGTPSVDVFNHLQMIIKQVRATKRGSESEGDDKIPVTKVRKPARKKADGAGPEVPTTPKRARKAKDANVEPLVMEVGSVEATDQGC